MGFNSAFKGLIASLMQSAQRDNGHQNISHYLCTTGNCIKGLYWTQAWDDTKLAGLCKRKLTSVSTLGSYITHIAQADWRRWVLGWKDISGCEVRLVKSVEKKAN